MARLTIKGNKKYSNEIIKLLESLGKYLNNGVIL